MELPDCMCDGTDFYGMPCLSFRLFVDEYNTDMFYVLTPEDFEMFPKVGTDV